MVSMISGFVFYIGSSLWGAAKKLFSGGSASEIGEALARPWKKWWNMVTEIFRVGKTSSNYE